MSVIENELRVTFPGSQPSPKFYTIFHFLSKKAAEICDSYVIGNVNIKYASFPREHLISKIYIVKFNWDSYCPIADGEYIICIQYFLNNFNIEMELA